MYVQCLKQLESLAIVSILYDIIYLALNITVIQFFNIC